VLVSTWPTAALRLRVARAAVRVGGGILRLDPERQAQLYLQGRSAYRRLGRREAGGEEMFETDGDGPRAEAFDPYGPFEALPTLCAPSSTGSTRGHPQDRISRVKARALLLLLVLIGAVAAACGGGGGDSESEAGIAMASTG
jgi:hypothetical protein